MKKPLLILTTFFFIYLNGQAQEVQEERKGFIGLSIGASIPTGEYASIDGSSPSAGFASGGSYLELVKFGYRFGKHFGIAASWYGLANQVNIQALASEFGKRAPVGTSGSIEAKPWSAGGLLVGPMYTINHGRFDFDITALIGYMGASSPETKVTMQSGTATATATTESKLEMAAAYKLGCDVRYKLAEKWALGAGVGYLSSTIEYSGIKTTDGAGKVYTGSSFSQPVNTVNMVVNIFYLLK